MACEGIKNTIVDARGVRNWNKPLSGHKGVRLGVLRLLSMFTISLKTDLEVIDHLRIDMQELLNGAVRSEDKWMGWIADRNEDVHTNSTVRISLLFPRIPLIIANLFESTKACHNHSV
jgi:hypothetical protein